MQNRDLWKHTFLELLIDWNSARVLTGGKYECSAKCQEEDEHGFRFLDKSRF